MPDDDNSGKNGTQPDGERMFSQSEVNRIMGETRREERERVERRFQQQQPAPQPAPAPQPDESKIAELTDLLRKTQQQVADMDAQRQFDAAVADKGLRPAQSGALFELYKTARPENLGAWVDAKVSELFSPPQVSEPDPEPDPEPTPPQNQPTGGAPASLSGQLAPDGLVDVFSLPPDEIKRMGPKQLREAFEKAVRAGERDSGRPPLPRALRKDKG